MSARVTLRRSLVAIVFIAAQAIPMRLAAQSASEPTPGKTACPDAADIVPAHLWGLWRVRFDDAAEATVLFERHPEFAGSVRGAINRDSVQSVLAGDVEDGELLLDESDDGRRISAVWVGHASPQSCGKAFAGTWRRSSDNAQRSFVLRKLPGWQ